VPGSQIKPRKKWRGFAFHRYATTAPCFFFHSDFAPISLNVDNSMSFTFSDTLT
jgi:hypothetical protein